MPWRLDHVQLAIPAGEEERCDEFYVTVLGFRKLERPAVLAARGGRWYQRGDALIHLGVDPSFQPATKAHPALVLDDYAATLGRLDAAGVTVRPDDSIPATTRCHLNDPVGNRLEFIDGSTH